MGNSVSEQATTKALNFVEGTTFKAAEAYQGEQLTDIHDLPALELQPVKALLRSSKKPGSKWTGYMPKFLKTGHSCILSTGQALELGIAVEDPATGMAGIPYSNMGIRKSADGKSLPFFE